jgi:regulator of sigma E protease
MELIFTALGYLYTHILPFIILLGILIFVHELGHFMVARWCGVRVEVFSLGFGKKIFSFRRGDTEYCVSIVPLGGYVKMFGEQGSEHVLTEDDKKVAFSHKNPWQRIAIVLAGPLMNFFFAVAVFAGIYQVGEESRAPFIAAVTAGSPAEQYGLRSGDKILQVNSQSVRSYEEFQKTLNISKGGSVSLLIQDAAGNQKTVTAQVTSIDNPNIFSLEKKLGQIDGIEPFALGTTVAIATDSPAYSIGLRSGDEIVSLNGKKVSRWEDFKASFSAQMTQNVALEVKRPLPNSDMKAKPAFTDLKIDWSAEALAKIGSFDKIGFDNPELFLDQVVKDSPASKAELEKYDKILSINSKKITSWKDVTETIRSYDGKDALTFTILRNGTEMIKKITPQVTEHNTPYGAIDKRYTVGILPMVNYAEPEMTTVQASSPIAALSKGTARTIDISIMTVMSFVRLFQGEVSVKNVGGMVSIGKAAKDSFEMGAQAFFMTMGILSVSLFVLNLLPIPVLDGGHLVFYTIELIKGSPLSLSKMEMAQKVGFVLLMALMILAQFNDIVRFIFKS